jgi:hypothetical protein
VLDFINEGAKAVDNMDERPGTVYFQVYTHNLKRSSQDSR